MQDAALLIPTSLGLFTDMLGPGFLGVPMSVLDNKFRNGTFDIWQRGTSGLLSSSTAPGAYTADGWIVQNAAGPALTVLQQTPGRLLSAHAMEILGVAGATDTRVKQRTEGAVTAPLTSQPVCFQAQIFNGTGSSITPQLSVGHAGAVDNWTTIIADVVNANLQLCPNNAWTQVSYNFIDTGFASNGLQVGLLFGASLNSPGATVSVAEADLRVLPGAPAGLNNGPPPPELRPIPFELLFCQRYYYRRSSAGANDVLGQLQTTAPASSIGKPFDFPTPMRATPTIAVSSTGHLSLTNPDGSDHVVTAIGAWAPTVYSLQSLTGLASSSTPSVTSLLMFNTSSGWIDASAEL